MTKLPTLLIASVSAALAFAALRDAPTARSS